jgi:hypothetical protein
MSATDRREYWTDDLLVYLALFGVIAFGIWYRASDNRVFEFLLGAFLVFFVPIIATKLVRIMLSMRRCPDGAAELTIRKEAPRRMLWVALFLIASPAIFFSLALTHIGVFAWLFLASLPFCAAGYFILQDCRLRGIRIRKILVK